MAETRDYTRLVPFTPPEGLLAWTLENSEALKQDVMVYRQKWETDGITELKYKYVEGYCSACGGRSTFPYYGACSSSAPYGFMADGPDGKPRFLTGGKETTCQCCGRKVKAVHCGSFRSDMHLGNAWPMTVHRIEDKLVLVGWNVNRELWKHGGKYKVHTEIYPYEAYVAELRKLVRLKGYEQYLSSFHFLSGWKQVKRCTDEWGKSSLFYPWDPALLEGSTCESSKLDVYMQAEGDKRAVSYLRLWMQHRNAENLVMQGAAKLLNDMMEHAGYASGYYGQKINVGRITDVDWKERRPAKMLGLTAEEFRIAVRLNLNTYGVRMIKAMKTAGQTLRNEEEIQTCACFGPEGVRTMAEKGLPVLKIVRYINKQTKKYPEEADKLATSTLEDYWSLAQKAGDDLTDPKVKWPQHLIASHDAALLRAKFQESKALVPKFEAVARKLEPMSWEAGGILIRPCRDESEMIREGKYLDHCVARYAKTHAEGKHCIFFIRKAEEPEVPWFTLELDVEKTQVLQNRGKQNCARTKEVREFEDLWLQHIRGDLKPKQQKERKSA